ncbi:hypothetical protein PG985_012957 [Apiospora marii]|uniref:Uncharacterized protein n=1 Tax=Apiospora marii TaxID=335849 RepID=A0ABR1RBZ8_9PEZI
MFFFSRLKTPVVGEGCEPGTAPRGSILFNVEREIRDKLSEEPDFEDLEEMKAYLEGMDFLKRYETTVDVFFISKCMKHCRNRRRWRYVIALKTTSGNENYISTKIAEECGFSKRPGAVLDIKLELLGEKHDCSVHVREMEQDMLLTEALVEPKVNSSAEKHQSPVPEITDYIFGEEYENTDPDGTLDIDPDYILDTDPRSGDAVDNSMLEVGATEVPDKSPEVGLSSTLTNMASTLRNQDRWDEAKTTFTDSLQPRQPALQMGLQDTRSTRSGLDKLKGSTDHAHTSNNHDNEILRSKRESGCGDLSYLDLLGLVRKT